MKNDLLIINTGKALHHWLSYISAVERQYVLEESSIIYPVAEYLGTKVKPDKIFLDKKHPNLIDRYLDLRLFNSFNKKNHFEIGLEFKYSRIDYTDQAQEKQRIFNDIIRLKHFVESEPNRKGYFIICGQQLDFIKSFMSIGWNNTTNGLPKVKTKSTTQSTNFSEVLPLGFYTSWFDFKKEDSVEIDLSISSLENKKFYDTFITEYKSAFEKGTNEITLRTKNPFTKLVYLSDGNYLSDSPMKVGIWEIHIK